MFLWLEVLRCAQDFGCGLTPAITPQVRVLFPAPGKQWFVISKAGFRLRLRNLPDSADLLNIF
jgi:hypothetical protein